MQSDRSHWISLFGKQECSSCLLLQRSVHSFGVTIAMSAEHGAEIWWATIKRLWRVCACVWAATRKMPFIGFVYAHSVGLVSNRSRIDMGNGQWAWENFTGVPFCPHLFCCVLCFAMRIYIFFLLLCGFTWTRREKKKNISSNPKCVHFKLFSMRTWKMKQKGERKKHDEIHGSENDRPFRRYSILDYNFWFESDARDNGEFVFYSPFFSRTWSINWSSSSPSSSTFRKSCSTKSERIHSTCVYTHTNEC